MLATIRSAVPEDAVEIHRLIRELAAYEREPDAVEATPARLREQLSRTPPPFQCLLAEVDGAVIGFALFFHNYSTWRGCPGLYLEDLYVMPHMRGRGVGLALFRAVARVAVERNCPRMEWAVLDWNSPALRFYESMGARPLNGWTVYRLADGSLREAAGGPV